jgi:polysaccharide biosynthesis/export protein
MKLLNALSFAFLSLLLLAVSACSSGAGSVTAARDGSPMSLPDTTSSVQAGDLKIAPLDTLDIRVFGVDRLSGAFQVDPLGQVDLPLLGTINVSGFNTFDLARLLERRLGDTYLQNPQVSVRISESFGQQVTVDGAVTKPGVYPIRGSITLLQAVALAGGMAETAEPRRVVIFRTIEGKRKGAAFDMVKIRSGESPDPLVFGNDIIIVDGSSTASGWREVVRTLPVLGVFLGVF